MTDPEDAHSADDLREIRAVEGRLPGNRYVRIISSSGAPFERRAPGYLVATEGALAPHSGLGRAVETLRRTFIGRRIASEREIHERIGPVRGLAVFASDNISSSAYATEEIMRVLAAAGIGALALTLPLTIAIVVVLGIVVTSYQQTVRAYPNGGGSYIVASGNLGKLPGLIAAAALLTDYVLTVAVSIAAGVAALTSIFPALFDARVVIGVAFVAILWLGNMRGVRESASLFAIPTYVYLFAIYGLLAFGLWRYATGTLPTYVPAHGANLQATTEAVGLLLLLRAFASGSVALTGTEAVSNGIPAFKAPEWKNAGTVLIMMGVFFGSIFLGISFLAGHMGVVPDPKEQETVISQITRTLVGAGTPYHYLIQLSTAFLLVLAANTAFADFPRLSSILAKDGFMPKQFQFRGDRLAFSVGIVVLAVLAALLIVVFGGSVTSLIPLYTVGVFVAFTLSQAGMVRHWWALRETTPGWRWRAGLNGAGAVATGIVALIVGVAKFVLGAWMILLLIPLLIALMWAIAHHYLAVRAALGPDLTLPRQPTAPPPRVVVPISRLDRSSISALAYARSISRNVTALHVAESREEMDEMRDAWERWGGDASLVIIESPYRALLAPLLAYLDARERLRPGIPTTVVLSELVPQHIWEYPLHNQTALRLKLRLFFRPNTVVVDVPYKIPGNGRRSSRTDLRGD